MNYGYILSAIVVMAVITAGLRFLPFLFFRGNAKTPKYVLYLGKVLPYAIMGMLVVYCLRNTGITTAAEWLPPLTASAVTVALHLWKRNTLFSILGGTVCYMLLVQFVFS